MRIILAAALILSLPLQSVSQTSDNCTIQLPEDVEEPVWLESFDTCNPDIRRFIERRIPGLEFYGPALDQLSQLSHAEQLIIIEGFLQKTDDHEALKMDLSVPFSLIEAILLEAASNGADSDWDIPAFEEVLLELRGDGETESGDTFSELRGQYAPMSTGMIFFVAGLEDSKRGAAKAARDAAKSKRGAAEAARDAAKAKRGAAEAARDAAKAKRGAAEAARDAAKATETRRILQDALAATQGN